MKYLYYISKKIIKGVCVVVLCIIVIIIICLVFNDMNIDWASLITTIIGFVSGGGIATIITLRATKKKAEAEAENTAISGLNTTIQTLESSVEHLQKTADRREEIIEELRKSINEYVNEIALLKTFVCCHKGCVLRKPTDGSWDSWKEKHDINDNWGQDYIPINQLLKRFGESRTIEGNENA